MKNQLKGFAAGCLFCVVLAAAMMAYAQNRAANVTYGVGVMLDGAVVEFEEDMRPFILDGRTFLPVRAVAELLGLNVDFDEDSNTVILHSWDLFEFPSDTFTDELDFVITGHYTYTYPANARVIEAYIIDLTPEPYISQLGVIGMSVVKLVDNEWREIPLSGCTQCGVLSVLGPGYAPIGNRLRHTLIFSDRLFNGEFPAGTYRIVTDVFRTKVLSAANITERDDHLVWAEFVIS